MSEKLIDHMRTLMASNFSLYLKTHAAHWNVSGMFFQSLHALFLEQYEDIYEQVDTIAEKIRRLDFFVPAGLAEFQEKTIFEDFTVALSATEYLKQLLVDHESMLVLLQTVFDAAETANNQALMNYLAERLDAHQMHRWKLRTTLNAIK